MFDRSLQSASGRLGEHLQKKKTDYFPLFYARAILVNLKSWLYAIASPNKIYWLKDFINLLWLLLLASSCRSVRNELF